MANYPFHAFREAEAPEGYVPFYISHLSRHGSRFDISRDADIYEDFHRLFEDAAAGGNLTAEGEAFRRDFALLYAEARSHAGDLTVNGHRDLKKIAANMYRRFPAVFDGDTRVVALNSGLPRTVQTMETVCSVLDSLDSSIEFSVLGAEEAAEELICWDSRRPYFSKADDDFIRNYSTAPWAERFDSLFYSSLKKEDILGRFFSKRPENVPERDFLKNLYLICATDICRDPSSTMLRDYLTPMESGNIWRAHNYRYYNIFGQGTQDGGRHWALMYPLLENLLDRADEDIAGGKCSLRLRFAHDSQLNPLLVLMGDLRFREHALDDDDVDRVYDWGFAPMASNLMLVFYHNSKGKVLVRLLMNDEDIALPLKPYRSVFYDWNALKRYFRTRLETAGKICRGKKAAAAPAAKVDGLAWLSSAYLWRGEQVCGVHFNPCAGVNFGRLRLENADYLAVDGSYKEIDWDLSYTFGNFCLHVADYYFNYTAPGVRENYFSWKKGSGNHVDEAVLVYSPARLPLRARWFTFFWGQWRPDSAGNPGRNSFESFLELEAWRPVGEYGTFTATLGTSVFKGNYTQYRKALMPVHAAITYTHTVPLGKGLSLPIETSVMCNPYSGACFASAGVGVQF